MGCVLKMFECELKRLVKSPTLKGKGVTKVAPFFFSQKRTPPAETRGVCKSSLALFRAALDVLLNACDITAVVGCYRDITREKFAFLVEGADIVCSNLVKTIFNS